jgi:NAD(P)H-quinone oxidoreductase subunit 5
VLHLVAHSFYKAHAFLSSGSVIDAVRAQRVALPRRLGNPLRIAFSVLIATAFYAVFSWLWGLRPLEQPSLLAVGAMLVMGLAQIVAPALDSDGPWKGTVLACLLAALVAAAFFSLESGAHFLLRDVLPELSRPQTHTLILSTIVLFGFGSAVLLQIIGLTRFDGPRARHLVVHLRNGFYANALFDRLVGGLRTSLDQSSEWYVLAGRKGDGPSRLAETTS